MFESILHQLSAIGADVFASLSIVASAAWMWVLAQPLWLTISVAGGIKLIAFGFMLREWRSKRAAAGKPAKRLTSVAPRQPKVEVIARSPRSQTPAQSARILVSRGLPEVEISRQTGLARDAVSLLAAAPKSAATRQGRPSAAGVAVPATSGRAPDRVALRA